MEVNALSPTVTEKPRKKRVCGSKKAQAKRARRSSHETGENCNCKRFNCFISVSDDERAHIIAQFNAMKTKDEQDSFLSSCIVLMPIQRRLRKSHDKAQPRDTAVKYFISLNRNGSNQRVQICASAFTSFFGISRKRVELIRASIMKTGLQL